MRKTPALTTSGHSPWRPREMEVMEAGHQERILPGTHRDEVESGGALGDESNGGGWLQS